MDIPEDPEDFEGQTTGSMMDAVYEELRRMATVKMAGERSGHTLQATALVNEAYQRLAGPGDTPKQWQDKRQFMAAAANAMRRILVECARKRNAAKRQREDVEFHDSHISAGSSDEEIMAINEALDLLEIEYPRAAEIVKLRYFVGYLPAEIAEQIGVCKKTVDRDWSLAKAWLYKHLKK